MTRVPRAGFQRLILVTLGLIAAGDVRGQDSSQRPSAAEPVTRPVVALHNYSKWEKEITAFEAADRDKMPPSGGILFTGSSTIRLWKTLADDFAGLPVINRGFGGSEIADATHFADRIIFPHQPKQIFIRAGVNDIHEGRLPNEVAADFADFVRLVHSRLPKTEIYFIAINPAPSRWGDVDKIRAMNKRVRKLALKMPRVSYVDTYDVGLNSDGSANPALFVADRLHFSPEGYKLLTERVRPYLPLPK